MIRLWATTGVLFILLLLTGCWDYSPLETKFVVTTIGIDQSEKDSNRISVTALGITYQSPNETVSADGHSITDALNNIQTRMDKKIALSHVQAVLFAESIAGQSISPYLDVFYRDPQMRSDAHFFVVKGKAADFLDEQRLSYPLDGSFIQSIFTHSETVMGEHTYDIQNVLFTNEANESHFTIPTIAYDAGQKMLEWDGLALFKNGSMIGELGKRQSIGLLMLSGNLQRTVYTFGGLSIGDESSRATTIRLFTKQSKVRWLGKKDPTLRFELEFFDEVVELDPWIRKKITAQQFEKLEDELERDIEELLREVLQILQKEHKLEVLGLRNQARLKWSDRYSKEKWNEQFAKFKTDVDVRVQVEQTGLLY